MARDWIVGFLHIVILMGIYKVYAYYPYDEIPVPQFIFLTYLIGAAYGVGGLLQWRTYLQTKRQADFNLGFVMIVVGFMIFIAEGLFRP
jgi:hypothetical protein